MKTAIVLLILLIPITSFSQKDTTCYFGVNGKIELINNGLTKKVVRSISAKKIIVRTYKIDQNHWQKSLYEAYNKTDNGTYLVTTKAGTIKKFITYKYTLQENGTYKFSEYDKGKLLRTGYSTRTLPLILQGNVAEFYANGKKKSESVYNNNELVSNKNWLEDGTPYFDNVFYSVDVDPTFTLGSSYLSGHIIKSLDKNKVDYKHIYGKMEIGFVVLENGQIDGFQVLRGMGPELNDIILSSFKTLIGQWTPAKLNGSDVRYFKIFPINFISYETRFDNIDFEAGSIRWMSN
jgi:hypothetical protein